MLDIDLNDDELVNPVDFVTFAIDFGSIAVGRRRGLDDGSLNRCADRQGAAPMCAAQSLRGSPTGAICSDAMSNCSFFL
ncbi:MAG: hypothetical protein O7D32_02360, partial [bacterium]|nr:hypothetical protein [bacterium]